MTELGESPLEDGRVGRLNDGEMVPAVVTLAAGPISCSIPLGAWVGAGGEVRFVPTPGATCAVGALAGVVVGWAVGRRVRLRR